MFYFATLTNFDRNTVYYFRISVYILAKKQNGVKAWKRWCSKVLRVLRVLRGGRGNRDALLFLVLTGMTVFQKNWKNLAEGVKISNFKKKVTGEKVFVRNTKLCLANILKIVEQSYYLSTLQRFLQNRKIALYIYNIIFF